MSNLYANLTSFVGETKTMAEVAKEAGFDFEVEKCELEAHRPGFTDVIMQHLCAIMRKDNGNILSQYGVAKDYGVVQFLEAVDFCEHLLTDGKAEIVYAGAPGSGCHLYLCMRAYGRINLDKNNAIENYFLVSTSHDGSAKLDIRVTPVLGSIAFLPYKKGISFKHSKRVKDRMRLAAKTIDAVTADWETFEEDTKVLLAATITKEQAQDYINTLVGYEDNKRAENIRDKIYGYYTKEGLVAGIPEVKNTMFAAYAAYVEWVNADRIVRKSKHRTDPVEAELYSKLRGSAVKEQTEAYAFAIKMANEMIEL